jgi:CheY-like chemotaxis protein
LNEKKTILVADDDPVLRDAIVFDFKRRGYQVFGAGSGVEAFEVVKKESVHAVITDIRMPNGTGVELLEQVKNYNLHIPVVIFITGVNDLTLEDAYDKGACVVMSKPFDRKILIANVEKALLSYDDKLSQASQSQGASLNIELKFSDSMDAVHAKALNIGQGGMCVVCEMNRDQVDMPISFRIEHPGYGLSSLNGCGVVRWSRECSGVDTGKKYLGVEFTFLDENCRKNIISFLENLNSRAYIPKGI